MVVVHEGLAPDRFGKNDIACMGSSLESLFRLFWASQSHHHVDKILFEILFAEVAAIPPANPHCNSLDPSLVGEVLDCGAVLMDRLHFVMLLPIVKHLLRRVDGADFVSLEEFLRCQIFSAAARHTKKNVLSIFLVLGWNIREIDHFEKAFKLI